MDVLRVLNGSPASSSPRRGGDHVGRWNYVRAGTVCTSRSQRRSVRQRLAEPLARQRVEFAAGLPVVVDENVQPRDDVVLAPAHADMGWRVLDHEFFLDLAG